MFRVTQYGSSLQLLFISPQQRDITWLSSPYQWRMIDSVDVDFVCTVCCYDSLLENRKVSLDLLQYWKASYQCTPQIFHSKARHNYDHCTPKIFHSMSRHLTIVPLRSSTVWADILPLYPSDLPQHEQTSYHCTPQIFHSTGRCMTTVLPRSSTVWADILPLYPSDLPQYGYTYDHCTPKIFHSMSRHLTIVPLRSSTYEQASYHCTPQIFHSMGRHLTTVVLWQISMLGSNFQQLRIPFAKF